jgi:prolyl 4-hydroxylase
LTDVITLAEQPGVLTEAQCSFVIETFRGSLQPSFIGGLAGKTQSKARTSHGYPIPRGVLRTDIADALRVALADVSAVSEACVEPWSLLHYAQGAYYRPHVDWFLPAQAELLSNGGQRTHSVIVYLSDVERGGETFFPLLRKAVTPRTGLLITWNNMLNGMPLFAALHESRAVEAGEKWALVTWIREREYDPAKAP